MTDKNENFENEKNVQNEEKKEDNKKEILFVILFVVLVLAIALFNFIVDPYYIFRDSTIKGFNNVKTHKYSSKRTIIYSDIKINNKGKDVAFTGNCLLSHYGSGLDNVGFFTVPVAKVAEVSNIIKNLITVSPEIKTVYWGLFFDDFWNDKNDEVNDTLPDFSSKRIELQDLVNLFFSYNTTKYSIETIRDSVKNHGEDIIYVYPFREIAKKKYDKQFSLETIKTIEETKEFAQKHGVNLVIYYSPIHVTKKMHVLSKGQWENYQGLKREIAAITDFYDYSMFNKYNSSPLDENNLYFVDNIHPATDYNNLIVNDLLSNDKKIGVLVTKENVKSLVSKDSTELQKFISNNKSLFDEIKNVSENDSTTKIKKKFVQ